jgi:hypothetical protein
MSNPNLNQSVSNQTVNHPVEDANPAIAQLHKLRQIALTRDTVSTFSQSIRLLFTLLKETGILLWLAVCYGLIAIGWVGNKAVESGQRAKSWLNSLRESSQNQSATEIAAETGKSVLAGSKTTIDYVMTQAKKQVGLIDQ